MIRFLLVLAILFFLGYLGLWLLKRHVVRFLKQFTPPPSSPTQTIEGEKLIACEICKTYIPLSKAIVKAGHYYCPSHAP